MGYHDMYEANANSSTIGSDEIWEVTFKGDDKVSLKGAHGRYLRWYGNGQVKAESDGALTNQDAAEAGTKFEIVPNCTIVPNCIDQSLKNLFGCCGNEICQMSMKSEQGKYVSALGYYKRYEANANSSTIGSDEIWEVTFKGDDMVSLKGAHGRYLRAYGNGQVKADAEKPNKGETFIVEDMGNGKLAFKPYFHKKNYLVAESDGALTNQKAAEAGTKFEIVPAATPTTAAPS